MPNLHVKPAAPLSRFVELLWYYEHPPRIHHEIPRFARNDGIRIIFQQSSTDHRQRLATAIDRTGRSADSRNCDGVIHAYQHASLGGGRNFPAPSLKKIERPSGKP